MLLNVTASSELGAVLRQFEAQGRSLQGAMPVIADMLVGAVMDVFDAEGPGWEPLAEATLKRRRNRDKSSAKILQDSGVLAGTMGTVIGADFVEAVAAASYGIFHVTGTKRMPKRDFTDLGPFESPLLDDIAATLLEQIV